MRSFTFDLVGVAIGLLLQASLCIVIFRKGLARLYPIFLIYLFSNLVVDSLTWVWAGDGVAYRRYYFIVTTLDYVLQLLIVFEIGLNVLRPSRRSIPFPILPIATVAVLLSAIVAASFSEPVLSGGPEQLQVTLSLAVLKLLLFAALAGFAQVLGISWRSHVLQLATGLAFFAGVSLLVQLGSSHVSPLDGPAYLPHLVRLNEVQSAAYILTLIFWIWAFSRNEAPRKDFTPQMQEVLVTIAKSAKRTRLAVTRSGDRR